MKKVFCAFLAAALAAATLAGCGGNKSASSSEPEKTASPAGSQAQAEKPVVLRIGHAQNEEGDWHLALVEFKKDLEARTNGQLQVEIYANETLGAELDNITAIQQGTCEGVVSGDSMSNWTPYAALVAMPYAVNSMEDLINIAGSAEIGGVIEENIVKDVKLHPVGFFVRSARNLTSNKEVKSIDNLKGLKVRVPNNPLHLAMWNAFGASANPMAWSEVFSALQNGTIEAQENPYANIISANLPEVQKYLIKTEHVYSWIYVLLGEDFWQTLTADQQAAVEASAKVMMDFQQQYLKEQVAEQEKTLQAQMTFIEIDKAPFVEIAKKVLEEQLSPEIYELYLKMVSMNKA